MMRLGISFGDTGGVGDFAGAAGKPMPMEQFEVDRMLGKAEEDAGSAAKVKIEFRRVIL